MPLIKSVIEALFKDLSLLTKLLTLVQQTMLFGNEFHPVTVLIAKKMFLYLILHDIYTV